MTSLASRTATVALSLGLAAALSACSGGDTGTSGGSAGGAAASPTPAAQVDALSGEQTAVTLDPRFLEGMTSLGLTPATLGRATLDGENDVVAFPITGGEVTYYEPTSGVEPYVRGLIEHDGSGLQITGPTGTVVQLEDFELDPDRSLLYGRVTVDGEVLAQRADLFFLDGSTLVPLRPAGEPGTAVLQGTTVSLTRTAADALNTVFMTDALTEFFPVGIAEITVATG